MIILSIETSCDETAISVIEAVGDFPHTSYKVLGDALFSQVEIHRQYGGVFPAVAKREHARTLIPMLEKALGEAHIPSLKSIDDDTAHTHRLFPETKEQIEALLSREGDLARELLAFFTQYDTPALDLIAVTEGPGLEPALWVGINFAKALALLWDVPVVGVNHMEGHIFSSLFDGTTITNITFPAVALLISGGHTEIVLMKEWGSYELIGKTRDDAVGEAFDKVARTLGLPYPGGPEISKRADAQREKNLPKTLAFPRPMLASNDCDFSFSGLKTAVLYYVKDLNLTDELKEEIAEGFEDAVTEVLLKKTVRALETYSAHTVILGGGVSANKHIRRTFETAIAAEHPDVTLYLPNPKLTTDNAVMIALAAHGRFSQHGVEERTIVANGNLSVSNH